jgi:hypothetical protein
MSRTLLGHHVTHKLSLQRDSTEGRADGGYVFPSNGEHVLLPSLRVFVGTFWSASAFLRVRKR